MIERFVWAYDNHGDMADPKAMAVFREFVEYFKPHFRGHGGDAFDLRALRSNASQEEKQEGVAADVDMGVDFLKWFNPHVWLWGNHDHRIVRKTEESNHGTLRDYCRMLHNRILDDVPNARMIPYGKRDGVFEYGDHRFIHGYNANLHAAYKAASHYGNVVMGHVHCTTGPVRFPNYDGFTGYSSGCLCRLEMEYNKGHINTLKQNHGFIYGFKIHGKLIIHHAYATDGVWVLPTEFKEVPGVEPEQNRLAA